MGGPSGGRPLWLIPFGEGLSGRARLAKAPLAEAPLAKTSLVEAPPADKFPGWWALLNPIPGGL